jgi:hypothetical protein
MASTTAEDAYPAQKIPGLLYVNHYVETSKILIQILT